MGRILRVMLGMKQGSQRSKLCILGDNQTISERTSIFYKKTWQNYTGLDGFFKANIQNGISAGFADALVELVVHEE